MSDAVVAVCNDVLKVDSISETFSCFLVHRSETEEAKLLTWQNDLTAALKGIPLDQLDSVIRQYLTIASGAPCNRLQLLLELLARLVKESALTPRLVCEAIIANEKLSYKQHDFWMESFKLLSNLIDGVEYKGVREIMKVFYLFIIFI